VPIHVPPLRERREDVPLLVRHFVDLMARTDRVVPRRFTDEAVQGLAKLEWPGNVRELRNTVERLLILAGGDRVDASDVELLVGGEAGASGLGAELLTADTFGDFKENAERAFILQKLRENDWNVSETARKVDMPRSNLYKKIEKYGLVRED
jgi:two-component system nitrogen regulation response regulator NtrX